jgi:hypothetical protein
MCSAVLINILCIVHWLYDFCYSSFNRFVLYVAYHLFHRTNLMQVCVYKLVVSSPLVCTQFLEDQSLLRLEALDVFGFGSAGGNPGSSNSKNKAGFSSSSGASTGSQGKKKGKAGGKGKKKQT